MTDQQPMGDVLNPVDIERAIRGISNRIAQAVPVVSQAYAKYLELDAAFDLAYARAFMAHDGPQTEKRYAAVIEVEAERTARDAADVAYRWARDKADALREELRAYQSVGASVRAMYSVAGRGEHM